MCISAIKNSYEIREGATCKEAFRDIVTRCKDVYDQKDCRCVIPLKTLQDYIIKPLDKFSDKLWILFKIIAKIMIFVLKIFLLPILIPFGGIALFGMVVNPMIYFIPNSSKEKRSLKRTFNKARKYHKKITSQIKKLKKSDFEKDKEFCAASESFLDKI